MLESDLIVLVYFSLFSGSHRSCFIIFCFVGIPLSIRFNNCAENVPVPTISPDELLARVRAVVAVSDQWCCHMMEDDDINDNVRIHVSFSRPS